MPRHYALSEWGAEHTAQPWENEGARVDTCPMCGEAKSADPATSDHSAGQIMYRLAEINSESPVALQVMLRMVMYKAGMQTRSMDAVADSIIASSKRERTMTRMAVYDACKRAARKFPELKHYLNPRRSKQ